jgi:L-ascorbate metabolism protein UlaG (beta-lactamase superfamily)
MVCEASASSASFPDFLSGVNVLVDPWLVGKLSFGGLEFIYAGSKRVAHPDSIDVDALARGTDLLVLTQGIDDHAHK